MALVKKKKGAGAVLLAAALTAAILLSAASVYSSFVMSRSRQHAKYGIYLVYLRKPPNADAMADDEDAHRRWHESFLPSTLTDSGEPRLRRTGSLYRYGVYGFTARLTVAEHSVVAKKPGFLSSSQLGLRTREHALHWVRTRQGQGADQKDEAGRQLKEHEQAAERLSDASRCQSEYWAFALISELEQFRAANQSVACKLDDFAEMENMEMASGDLKGDGIRGTIRKSVA